MEAASARSTKRRAPAVEESRTTIRSPAGGVVDRISSLPDALLGEIITLLPTKEGARTQIISPRWRHLWSSAPLNLDCHGIAVHGPKLDLVVSRVLSTHPGPGRRFCVSTSTRHAALDGWLRSPALDNLQELKLFLNYDGPVHPLPLSVFRFSSTLCIAYFRNCHIPDLTVQVLHLPLLRQLGLYDVTISQCSLHSLIDGCPILESLLMSCCTGFRRLRIDSLTLRGFACHDGRGHGVQLNEIIIHNAPCLQRALLLASSRIPVFVGMAPNLEMVGITNLPGTNTFVFPSTVIQGLPSDKFHAVKILRVNIKPFSLDMAIEFLTCFPSLEKLYIQGYSSKPINSWRRKHKALVKSIDISLKILVLESPLGFHGAKSQVNFLTFFVLNAKVLELMTLFVDSGYDDEEFLEEQRRKLQLDKRASRGAHVHFTTERCLSYVLNLERVHDLEIDPFLI